MLTADLETRKSRRYVDAYGHLDDWEFVGSVRVTPPRMVREPRDFDDGGSYVRWVRVPADVARTVDPKTIRRALADTFSFHGCGHDYDCCGCSSVSASAERVGRRDWVLRERHSFNY